MTSAVVLQKKHRGSKIDPMLSRFFLTVVVLTALAAGAGSLRAQEPEGQPFIEEHGSEGRVLNIPGFGRIPLGPGGALPTPSRPSLAPAPKAEAPALRPLTPEQKQAQALDELFRRLAEAEDEGEAQALAASILRRFAQSGSDTVDLLLARAGAAEAAGAAPLAKSLLDYVLILKPDWPEALVRRGRILGAQGDMAAGLADLEAAARLEPRRFDAFAALGALAEATGDKKRALEAYRRSLAIDPQQDALRKSEEKLSVDVDGRDI
jgi:hypothetical protein